MALKETITSWNEGVKSFQSGDFSTAFQYFQEIAEPSAYIYFNLACISSKLGRLQEAIRNLTEAVTKDPYFIIGYYQRGLHYFTLQQFDKAADDFEKSREKMHSRQVIDYSQLGLTYKLYAIEIWLSWAASYQRKGQQKMAIQVVIEASKELEEDDNKQKCVDTVHLLQRNSGFLEPAVIPDNVFHPPKELLANIKKREYVGKSKVVSSYDDKDTDTLRRRSPTPEKKKSNITNSSHISGNELQIPEQKRKVQSMPVDQTRHPRPRLGSSPPDRPPPKLPHRPQPEIPQSRRPQPPLPQDGYLKSGDSKGYRPQPPPPKGEHIKSDEPKSYRPQPPPPIAGTSNDRSPRLKPKPDIPKIVSDAPPLPQKEGVQRSPVKRNNEVRGTETFLQTEVKTSVNPLHSELSKVLNKQFQKLSTSNGDMNGEISHSPKNSAKPPRPPPPNFVNNENDVPPPVPKKDYPRY